jgi:hypothetical protein
MPSQRGINDRIPAASARQRRRGDQLIDHCATRTLWREACREKHTLRSDAIAAREPQAHPAAFRDSILDRCLVPGDMASIDGSPERAQNVGRNRATMPRLPDHRSATVEVALAGKPCHASRTEPTGIAIELVSSQWVARDEVNLDALRAETERDLGSGDAAAHDRYGLETSAGP